jgi:hypothetical protein
MLKSRSDLLDIRGPYRQALPRIFITIMDSAIIEDGSEKADRRGQGR